MFVDFVKNSASNIWPLKIRSPQGLETLGNRCPVTKHNIPEE